MKYRLPLVVSLLAIALFIGAAPTPAPWPSPTANPAGAPVSASQQNAAGIANLYTFTTTTLPTFLNTLAASGSTACSATSQLPCSFTFSCAVAASAAACGTAPTVTVPAGANCTLTLTSDPIQSPTIFEPYIVSLSTNTLTLNVVAPATVTAGFSATGNGHCS